MKKKYPYRLPVRQRMLAVVLTAALIVGIWCEKPVEVKPKRKPGRPKKVKEDDTPKRRPGRPKKVKPEEVVPEAPAQLAATEPQAEPVPVKRRPGRPRKTTENSE